MGIREESALGCQSVDIRCSRLGVTAKTACPVVEVVDGEENDVWFFCIGIFGKARCCRREQERNHEKVHSTVVGVYEHWVWETGVDEN